MSSGNARSVKIEGSRVLVTGANRGLGRAFCEAFVRAGAAKVYAGARNPASVSDPRVIPVELDVTVDELILTAAQRCSDVDLLVNNAGIMLDSPLFAPDAERALRREMDVNVFGVLAMLRAFAPLLKRNGGGAIVNVLSVVSLFVNPANATYCATKHAALALTDGARIELKEQGTQVVGVYAGYIDTDMAAGIDRPKTSAQQVADRTLDGLRADAEQVLADDRARSYWVNLRSGIPAYGS
jgi:NAD(P)-dependent dehydrogenase (short-subunit alcohol dehydrogenase family)